MGRRIRPIICSKCSTNVELPKGQPVRPCSRRYRSSVPGQTARYHRDARIALSLFDISKRRLPHGSVCAKIILVRRSLFNLHLAWLASTTHPTSVWIDLQCCFWSQLLRGEWLANLRIALTNATLEACVALLHRNYTCRTARLAFWKMFRGFRVKKRNNPFAGMGARV